MTPAQLHAIRQAYSDSFSEAMKVCAAVSAACAVACLLAFRWHGVDLEIRIKELAKEEDEMIRSAAEAKEAKERP